MLAGLARVPAHACARAAPPRPPVAGALTAPTCNDGNWWDRTPRLNTWQTGGYGQWDLEVSSWRSPDPNTPIMNTPIVISNVGRAFPWGCLSGYLAASGCGYAARLSSSRWRRSSRWQLEPVPGRPYVFYISSLVRGQAAAGWVRWGPV